MSRPAVAASAAGRAEDARTDATLVTEEGDVTTLLDALNDADCRAILDATGDEALSANEVADACDLPLSTVYRKLDRLTDAGLLDERTRVRSAGKHPSEYARRVEDVLVSVGDGGDVELRISW